MKYNMLSLLLCAGSLSAFANPPAFNDYLIYDIHHGANHELAEPNSGNEILDKLRMMAIKKKPNFAGRYYLYTFGCGGGAICGEVLDLKLGRVSTGLPDAYNGDGFDISFKVDSSLLIISGDGVNNRDSEHSGPSGNDLYYNFEGNKFKQIH